MSGGLKRPPGNRIVLCYRAVNATSFSFCRLICVISISVECFRTSLAANIVNKLRILVHRLVGGLKGRHLEHMPHPLEHVHLHTDIIF